jgi:hypothetical protein
MKDQIDDGRSRRDAVSRVSHGEWEPAADRPDPIDAPADGNALICCSQPQGDIAIDL